MLEISHVDNTNIGSISNSAMNEIIPVFDSVRNEIIPGENEGFDEWLVGSNVRGVMENGSGMLVFIFVLNTKINISNITLFSVQV